ncbi:MAG: N(4)-(beta-N-acetylglucosaminyl)-L-asparaginase [Planctomycetes bacterium]|nr:N(4)-(beta-N-acetylglucosaminyl)-L-asparaginase [Planctomycetota bacterium]
MSDLSRRKFLRAAAVGAAVTPACSVAPAAAAPSVRVRRQSPIAVASSNGLEAVRIAVERMQAGMRPVDAAVAGVEVVENDPNDNSVGLGGLPNERGIVTLDSCVMDGPSGLGGAVAHLQNIKNPAQVALKVMRHTDHVLLVAEGALEFARAHGFREQDLLTDASRKIWLEWLEKRSSVDDWISPEENGEHGTEWFQKYKDKTGTIHLGAVDANGDVGSCTTTSGLAFKLNGRVGDSPLLGCGNYCDNDVGTGGSTGRGEACILVNGAAFTVHQMALGKSPTDACLETVKRVARMTRVARLLDAKGRPDFQVKFYATDKRGRAGAAAMYPGKFAVCDDSGPRLEDLAALFDSRD